MWNNLFNFRNLIQILCISFGVKVQLGLFMCSFPLSKRKFLIILLIRYVVVNLALFMFLSLGQKAFMFLSLGQKAFI